MLDVPTLEHFQAKMNLYLYYKQSNEWQGLNLINPNLDCNDWLINLIIIRNIHEMGNAAMIIMIYKVSENLTHALEPSMMENYTLLND